MQTAAPMPDLTLLVNGQPYPIFHYLLSKEQLLVTTLPGRYSGDKRDITVTVTADTVEAAETKLLQRVRYALQDSAVPISLVRRD